MTLHKSLNGSFMNGLISQTSQTRDIMSYFVAFNAQAIYKKRGYEELKTASQNVQSTIFFV